MDSRGSYQLPPPQPPGAAQPARGSSAFAAPAAAAYHGHAQQHAHAHAQPGHPHHAHGPPVAGPSGTSSFRSASDPSSSRSSSSAAHGYAHAHYGGARQAYAPESAHEPEVKFDLVKWYPQYQSCLSYFVEKSQHSYACQALAAFINIKLPLQRHPSAFISAPADNGLHPTGTTAYGWVSLHPYLRRLVATGFDSPAILCGWFGDNWQSGVGPMHEQERRNYLFAAKSGGWAAVKKMYDFVDDEGIPFLMPLGNGPASREKDREIDAEVEAAEQVWSKWLCMEDWMLGTKDPMALGDDGTMDEMDAEPGGGMGSYAC